MVSHTPIFAGREEYLYSHCLSYRINCLILGELAQYLKDCPGFSKYDALHRAQWTRSCEASYERGGQRAGGEETLLESCDVGQENFLDIQCAPEELREHRKAMCRDLPAGWNGYFKLYDMVMSDAGDFEAMYASFLGVKDADPSPEFLALVKRTVGLSDQMEGSWFPTN